MNDSPLNKAHKKLRFSELRRDGQLNRINALILKRIKLTTEIEKEKQILVGFTVELKQSAQHFYAIRDGKTV